MVDRQTNVEARTCALLFIGLPKHFKDIVLPSIRKHILSINPACDIFVHVYNISSTTNPRNNENSSPLHPDEVYLMREATSIVFETMDEFGRHHDVLLYRKYSPPGQSWSFPSSIDSMIKQWHSIAQAWKQMVLHETYLSGQAAAGSGAFQYRNVGIFRSDVLYTNDINITDGSAVTACFNFGRKNDRHQTNDRMFYGLRSHAEKWATARFGYVEEYMKTEFGARVRLHSESFLSHMLSHFSLDMQCRDICFHRVRATGQIRRDDCRF
jgi:hypothetical protein